MKITLDNNKGFSLWALIRMEKILKILNFENIYWTLYDFLTEGNKQQATLTYLVKQSFFYS